MEHYTGSCLCGGIQYEIRGELAPVQICHCQQCRKAQGAALVTNIPVPTDQFSMTQGEDLLKVFESSPGKQRVFCNRCGSPILSRLESLPGVVRIRAGTLDGEPPLRLMDHAYVGSKASWWPIIDDLPRLEGGRPPKR
ncbi:GFA family protein [Marinobacter sp. M1N3S26]|uniref:GFA family protein n=1 Tax=unclassified Marinobacter TaxID=83889 RepID=UPI00387B60B5